MNAPVSHLLASVATLLADGSTTYGIPAAFVAADGIPVYRGDQPLTIDPPFVQVCQAGPAKERHVQGSGLWEIPVSAKLIVDRNGGVGDSEADVEESFRALSDELEGVLTRLLTGDVESTPEQRLTNAEVHVWAISNVEVAEDKEMDGDPSCEVTFTAFCSYAERIIIPA